MSNYMKKMILDKRIEIRTDDNTFKKAEDLALYYNTSKSNLLSSLINERYSMIYDNVDEDVQTSLNLQDNELKENMNDYHSKLDEINKLLKQALKQDKINRNIIED